MKLKSLRLENFKGIKKFKIEPNSQDIQIIGQNGTGKSSIFDGFLWLLFNKDSRAQAKFGLKRKDPKTWEEIPGLDHIVEAELILEDGSTLGLAKTYKEVWKQKKGSTTKQFSGHTTQHYIDGAPVQKKEYDTKINELIDEGLFRLITDPKYFNEQLNWQQRREIIMEMAGDVTDQEVIDSKKDLQKLPEILENRSTEQHKKKIKSEMKEINKELEQLPARIDEVDRGRPNLDDINDRESLDADIEKIKGQLKEQQDKRQQVESQGATQEIKNKIGQVDNELLEIKNIHHEQHYKDLEEDRKQLDQLNQQIRQLESDIEGLKEDDAKAVKEKGELEEKIPALRQEVIDLKAQEFEPPEAICDKCNQELPEDQREELINKAKAEFEEKRDREVKAKKQEGKQAVARYEELTENISSYRNSKIDLESKLSQLTKTRDEYKARVDNAEVPALEDNEDYQVKLKEKQDLEQQLKDEKQAKTGQLQELDKTIEDTERSLEALKGANARLDQDQKAQQRIEELQQREETLAAEYQKLEKELHLLEQFTKTKVSMLESRINEHFNHVTFKMFEEYISGGIEDTCEVMLEGRPYKDMSTGERILAGLDIINALIKYYGTKAPIFVDNRESLTIPLETPAQIIELIAVQGQELQIKEVE